jgi:hypothetical protein
MGNGIPALETKGLFSGLFVGCGVLVARWGIVTVEGGVELLFKIMLHVLGFFLSISLSLSPSPLFLPGLRFCEL